MKKKIISNILILVLIITTASTGTYANAIGGNQAKTSKKTPYLQNYSLNKQDVKIGDTVNAEISIIDPNLTDEQNIKNSFVTQGDESNFTFEDGEIYDSSLKVEKGIPNFEIKINILNMRYLGEGHNLSFSYGFTYGKTNFSNFISFTVDETMFLNNTKMSEKPIVENTVDQRVLEAQQWLNATYTGKHGYTPIPEDGKPGVVLSETMVVALQIELGIAEPTGTFGPTTQSEFQRLVGSLNIGSQDSGKNYVRLLQHALFCKGYNPTSVTGTFAEGTAGAVLKLKNDAGFSGTTDSSVNAMWYKAILNSDAYVLVNNGDATTRSFQQILNRDYYAYFGIMPCDGHYSRDTNKALVYAWQATEGLGTDIANGNFGPTTQALSPNLPSDSRYSEATLNIFTRLMKYALYWNNVSGSTSLTFDGNYDARTYTCVQSFEKFMCITPADGNIYLGTMMSLMTSRGDPNRSSTGCDCATQLDYVKAKDLHEAGYQYVGRYLTSVNGGLQKHLTIDECRNVSNAGLRIFPIFQEGGATKDYFNYSQGVTDGGKALEASANLKIPIDTIIYFAVDYDFMDIEVTSNVIPYFQGVNSAMGGSVYNVGVYGSRNICTRVSKECGAKCSFVSDMSTGYSGNYGYPMPTNWSFDQFDEYDFSGGFGLDKDAFSGRDTGFAYTNSGKYNRDKVREYAEKWAEKKPDGGEIFNPKYFNFDADCANFVSQCLYEAGFGMSTSWYSAFNPLKGETMTVEEDPEKTNNPLWSSTWSVAREQHDYFSEQSHGYILGQEIYVDKVENDKDTTIQNIKQAIQNAKSQGLPIKVGDLVYFENKEKGLHHATIITDINDDMIYYSGHTSPCNNKSLVDGLFPENDEEHDTNIRIVRMNDICFLN